jgi:hypothetical protein
VQAKPFRPIGLLMTAAICGWASAQTHRAPSTQPVDRVAEVVKPTAEELKWQRIPWMTDLAEGQRMAQRERRPLFLWVTGDDPLERC